jgi:hypothetical protein
MTLLFHPPLSPLDYTVGTCCLFNSKLAHFPSQAVREQNAAAERRAGFHSLSADGDPHPSHKYDPQAMVAVVGILGRRDNQKAVGSVLRAMFQQSHPTSEQRQLRDDFNNRIMPLFEGTRNAKHRGAVFTSTPEAWWDADRENRATSVLNTALEFVELGFLDASSLGLDDSFFAAAGIAPAGVHTRHASYFAAARGASSSEATSAASSSSSSSLSSETLATRLAAEENTAYEKRQVMRAGVPACFQVDALQSCELPTVMVVEVLLNSTCGDRI